VDGTHDDDFDESMAYESDPDISALDAHMTQLVQEKMKSSEGKENVRQLLLLLCGYLLGRPANLFLQPPNEYGVVTTVICENFMVSLP
jgi:hypothetical protein